MMNLNPLDPDAPAFTPIDLRGWRHRHDPEPAPDAADEHLPQCEFLMWPTPEEDTACQQALIERARLFKADPEARMGDTHTMHLVYVYGAHVTIWGALRGLDIARVPVCMHGNFPPIEIEQLQGPALRVEYCYECAMYLPAGLRHSPPPALLEALGQ